MPSEQLPAIAEAFAADQLGKTRQAQSAASAQSRRTGAEPKALQEACQGFEAIFLNMMLQEMRKSLPEGGLLPTSSASRTWQQLFDNQLAESLAQKQEMGIARLLYQQLQDLGGAKK